MQTPKGEINDNIMKLMDDQEILQKMSMASSPEECYDVVKDRIGISFEEFQSSMSVAMSYLNENKSGELSEDDLDAVAGGKADGKDTAKIIGSVTGAVGAAAGIAGAIISSAAGAVA